MSAAATPSPPPAPAAATAGHPGLAVVLTGGGARAAYQAGVLRGIGRRFPDLRFPIVTGVSAGAINAAYLAAHPGGLGEAADGLCRIWERIAFRDVFRVDFPFLGRNLLRWLGRLAAGGSALTPQVRGLVDTAPLRRLLERELAPYGGPILGITRNVAAGHLRAISLATVNYGTGQTINWVEGADIVAWERPERRARQVRLSVEHVMASAALPLVFPAIALDHGWYGDGGIRMSAPLSPALHLGAERILALSTRYLRSRAEADRSSLSGYPPPAQIAGNLMNAIFLDVLDQDALRLERMNSVVRGLPAAQRGGMRVIDILLLRPTADLGRLSAGFEPRLPRGLRFLTRGLGTRETESPDFLSLLMFQPEYLCHLIELGERDAEARFAAIAPLVTAPAAEPAAPHPSG